MNFLFPEAEISTSVPLKQRRVDERRRKAKQAYEATSAVWKRETYRVAVEEFLPRHDTFLFEELSTYYNSLAERMLVPATVNGKAFAGLQRVLISEGKIELIKGVTRTRSNGQDGKVYRSNLYQPEEGLPC
jgi:hypothetical protein